MNIYIWEGDGVLTDYTDGMIVAIANSLEEAHLCIEADDGIACYRRHVDGKDEWTFNFPYHPSKIIPFDMAEPQAFVCWGGG